MSTLYKYRVWCVTEGAYVEEPSYKTTASTECPNDSGHTIGDVAIVGTISSDEFLAKSIHKVSFIGDGDEDYIEAKATYSWRVMSTFEFPGTDVITPTELILILSRTNGSGTSYFRIFDPDNGNVIVDYTYTDMVKKRHVISSFSNLPTGPTIFEIWAKRSSGKTRIHYMELR